MGRDIYSILVPKDLRVQINNKKCIIEDRDTIELLSLEKEPNNVEYIDEFMIEVIRPDNEIENLEKLIYLEFLLNGKISTLKMNLSAFQEILNQIMKLLIQMNLNY